VTRNGEATAPSGGRFRRFLFAGAALLLLAACAAKAPVAPASAPDRPAAPVAAMRPAAARAIDLARLDGLTPAELVQRFGEPDFRRAEPPAELWQYRGARCVLELFLYDAAGGIRVLRSEAYDRSLDQRNAALCAGGGDALTHRGGATPL
jgi:hypothetical protein